MSGKVLNFQGQTTPDASPLSLEDFETVVALVSPDTAHALRAAETHLKAGDVELAIKTLASKLALADLRSQDAEAVISVLVTHTTNYAEAVAADLLDVEEGEKQALARVLPFVLESRPQTTLAGLVDRVKRMAVADAAAYFSIDN